MESKPPSGAAGPAATGAPKRGPDRRSGKDRRTENKGPVSGPEKRLAERRTGLDRRRPHLHYEDLKPHPRPERNINDYPLSTDEVEFINAINDYKSKFNRPFPTWSEILHVLRTLGYIRTVDFEFRIPAEGGPFDPPPPAPAGKEGGSGTGSGTKGGSGGAGG